MDLKPIQTFRFYSYSSKEREQLQQVKEKPCILKDIKIVRQIYGSMPIDSDQTPVDRPYELIVDSQWPYIKWHPK